MSSKKTKKRIPLSRERILQAAMNYANQQGIESLSMRKLAEQLKVEAMSLYNHVAHKEDLLNGMVEAVVSEIDVPDMSLQWQDALRQRAHSAHQVLLRYPWAALLIVSRLNVGPAMLRYVDATIGCLVQAGFSYPLADHAWNAIDSHIYGFTLQELNFPLEPEQYADAASEFLPQLPAGEYPYLTGMSQQVISGQHNGLHDFEFGLEILLAGLESLRIKAAQGDADHEKNVS